MGKISTPGKSPRKRTLIIIAILGLGLLAGTAYAAMQSIQLNSSATFPVDI